MNNKESKLTENHPDWKGYTIDELRYQQAYTQARLEIERERIAAGARALYSGGVAGKASGIMGKVLGSLSYVDYALLAFRFCRKVYTILHRRRA